MTRGREEDTGECPEFQCTENEAPEDSRELKDFAFFRLWFPSSSDAENQPVACLLHRAWKRSRIARERREQDLMYESDTSYADVYATVNTLVE